MKIPYFVPWINSDDKKSVVNVLNQRSLTNGPILEKFEQKFSNFLSSKYSLGVSNATNGLHLVLYSLGIGPGDEVIVPTLTFSATADVVSYCGAKPILTDIDPDTFNIKIDSIKKNLSKKTKAIIPVHYGGQSCDMDEIISISKKYNLKIIEDCAHALGSTFLDKKCGTLGNAGCFSFYPTKIITTGEGGMISTNDFSLSKKIKSSRSHGVSLTYPEREKKATWKYDILQLGFNYRLDEIRSSLGLSQLSRIKQINSLRIKIAKKYNSALRKIKGIEIPFTESNRNHIYHLYTIKITKDFPLSRDELFDQLYAKGIGTSVQYVPLHDMSYNKKLNLNSNNFPFANKIKNQIISLPIYPKMTQKEIEYVIQTLKDLSV